MYIYQENVYLVSTSLVLSFGSPILFYVIYIFFFSQFSFKHMFGYSQSQQQWEIIYTHCCKSYSEEVKHIAVNLISIAEAGQYPKKHIKKMTLCKAIYVRG